MAGDLHHAELTVPSSCCAEYAVRCSLSNKTCAYQDISTVTILVVRTAIRLARDELVAYAYSQEQR